MKSTTEVVAFSTRSHRADESVRAWRRHLAEVYFRLDVAPHDRDHIEGHLRVRELANLKVSELRGSRQRMVRTAHHAKLDNIESFVFICPVAGEFSYRHGRVSDLACKGQLFALPSADFHEVSILDKSRMLCVEVPHHLLRNRMEHIYDFCAAGTFSDPLVVGLLRDALDRILSSDTGVEAHKIEDICLTLIEAAVSDTPADADDRRRSRLLDSALYDRLIQIMKLNLADNSFEIGRAAAACGVSMPHLKNVLQARNTTFAHALTDTRLTEAEKMIRSSPRQATAISQIAALCGFASPGYFSTSYRRRFGKCPREDLHA